jgi:hypothetical protein
MSPQSGRASFDESAFACPVAVFERNQRAFGDAEQTQHKAKGNWHPEEDVNPERRLELELDDDRHDCHQSAHDHDEECCGTITHVELAEI